MKLNFIWAWAFAASTVVVVAACGSTGGSVYNGGDGGPDGTVDTGPLPVFESGTSDRKPGCNPLTCKKLGYTCGPTGDGCGGKIECGTCKSPETCGGGGKFSRCGGKSACVPKTCKEQGISCGPAGDGCGGTLACGSCKSPETCGGSVHSECGTPTLPDGGSICKPLTCADQSITCGPAGDGCGGSIAGGCGSCPSGESCGGGGTPSQCGSSMTSCIPKKCSDLGITCGTAGDGCGGSLSCGTCTAPATCGGGSKPGVCGSGGVLPDGGWDGGVCIPLTCSDLGITCGPAGNGCGGLLDCGTCSGSDTCGGGGVGGMCGHPTACVPATCGSLGIACGPAGDGCGGLIASCGTCTLPNICGGGGIPGQCGDVPACTGLCLDVPSCGLGTTTLTGTVVAGTQAPYLGASPSSPDPVPNVLVYVPNGASVDPFVDGPACGCATVSGDPLVISGTPISTNTDYQGNFTLTGIPVPPSGVIPLVIQLGRWRRVFGLGNPLNPGFSVTKCVPNATGAIHMPRNKNEGDIPLTAVSTGNVDAMECVLLKMGVDAAEFTDPGGTGRIQFFQGNGAIIDGATPAETTLVPTSLSATELDLYDQVLFPCWGVDPIPAGSSNAKTANQQTNVINYANAGGRVFATHYSYSWLYNVSPFSTTATWIGDPVPETVGGKEAFTDIEYNTGTANIQHPSTFADVNTFYLWMNALTTNGSAAGAFSIVNERNNFSAVAVSSEPWVNVTGASCAGGGITDCHGTTVQFDPTNPNGSSPANYNCVLPGHAATCVTEPTSFPVTYTFDTPVATPPACGKVIYSDFHVSGGTTGGKTFPAECTSGEMTAQEKSLEYLIWDLAACPPGPPPPVCTPETCSSLGYSCGTGIPDGCGGTLDCDTPGCTGCETCGGGGVAGKCGGVCCAPETCASLGFSCGSYPDGCGGTLACGTCALPLTCGGGGTPGVCGEVEAGGCLPETCALLGYACGKNPDGCGGTIDCGSCSGCETCGGGGTAGVCGGTCCVPLKCGDPGTTCGKSADGCGGTLSCPACPVPDGAACIPLTCKAEGISCGPAGDGCGGSLDCGKCTGGTTCGGGGTPGKCGAPKCTPKTCKELGFDCGPAGDGCGGTLNCGKCSSPETCGGGGSPGQCGSSTTK